MGFRPFFTPFHLSNTDVYTFYTISNADPKSTLQPLKGA